MARKKTMIRIASVGLCLGGGGLAAAYATSDRSTPVVTAATAAPAQDMADTTEQTRPLAPITPVSFNAANTETALPTLPNTDADALGIVAQPSMLQPVELPSTPPKGSARQLDSAIGLSCGLEINAVAMPAAMVELDVVNPCQADARIEIVHSGLSITAQADQMGHLSVDLPAFENPAFITVNMPDGTGEDVLVTVPDFENFGRVAIQWAEDRGLELHAYEFAAEFGGEGHIWSENPHLPERAVSGEGGFLTQLGAADVEDPSLAMVYTFPRTAIQGELELAADAPITAQSCGQTTQARTLETRADGSVAVVEVSFVLPECEAIGDFVLLQNLFQDLRVASN